MDGPGPGWGPPLRRAAPMPLLLPVPLGLLRPAAVALLMAAALAPAAARAQVQLRCDGTLLESRGSAEMERPTRRLLFSLGLEADGAGTDAALGLLQARLAAVRDGLKGLAVEELRVTSPSTWQRTDSRGRPAGVQANLQVSGRLAPERLQPLIRQVGALPGVRLAPVTSQADPSEDAAVRRRLLAAAYGDARAQAGEVAAAIGRLQLEPLEVVLSGDASPGPMLLRGAAAAAPPPFDPAELAKPKDRLSLMVRFCAR